MDKKTKELLHYVVVFGVLLVSWVPIMNAMGGNVYTTSVLAFFVFVIADQLAHKAILGEPFSIL